jgi:DNA-binding transcriptional MerR regulator
MMDQATAQGPPAQRLRIGALAERAGVTVRTLRYYESLGLLQCEPRRQGAFRLYDDAALQRLERIRQLKDLLGFTLDEVRRILAAEDAVAALRERYLSTDDSAERIAIVHQAIELTQRQADLVAQKQGRLDEMRGRLEERLARYRQVLGEMTAE